MFVGFKNLPDFDRVVKGWLKEVEVDTTKAVKGLAKFTLMKILTRSPQYSGDFVANWNTSVGTPDTSFTENVFGTRSLDEPTFHKGSSPAIAYAYGKADAGLSGFTLGKTIYLANNIEHPMHIKRMKDGSVVFEGVVGDKYGRRIEDGTLHLRPVNEGGHHPMKWSVLHVGNRFATINRSSFATLMRYAT